MFPSTPPLSARFLLVRIFMVAGERRSSCFVLQKHLFPGSGRRLQVVRLERSLQSVLKWRC